jgi:cytochrome c
MISMWTLHAIDDMEYRTDTRSLQMIRASGLSSILLIFATGMSLANSAIAAGDVGRGEKLSRACMACHSFAPGRNLTGPSLAGVWGRKAGTADGFGRYSQALKRSGIVWDAKSLDAWLKNPAELVAGNSMAFRGMPDARDRADLLAYLEAVTTKRRTAPDNGLPDLKLAGVEAQVSAVNHCGDAYRVTTADHRTHTFWEFNLRFKTDGSPSGPAAGKPVIVGNGMQGDRAAVVFSRPEEISIFIRQACP